MKKFIKNISVVTMLSASFIAMVIHTPLMAMDSSSSPILGPEALPKLPALNASTFSTIRESLTQWFQKNGGNFLNEKFPGGLPSTGIAFKQNDPVTAYQLWYAQNYGGGGKASAEELERIRQEARAHASGEVVALRDELSRTKALAVVGLGREAAQLMQVIEGAKTADIDDIAFEAHNATITVPSPLDTGKIKITGRINGSPLLAEFDGSRAEYERLQMLRAVLNKMYSKAYSEASGALADVASTILASASPQAHHLKQIGDLSATSSKLDEFLRYHQTISTSVRD